MRAVTILDGGMGHELKRRDMNLAAGGFLATLLAMESHPQAVAQLHSEYISSGAQVLTANSFIATRWSLRKENADSKQAHFIQLALKLARKAIENAGEAGKGVRVAASLPPLEESYQTEGLPAPSEMLAEYRDIAAAASSHCDLFLCETMASLAEARTAVTAAHETAPEKPIWVSFTLRDDASSSRLRDGSNLEAAVEALLQFPKLQLEAILVNCTAPAACTAGIKVLAAIRERNAKTFLFGAYANGFRMTTDSFLGLESESSSRVSDSDFDQDGVVTPEAYARHAKQWVEDGADIVGGCCAVGPTHIAELSRTFKGV